MIIARRKKVLDVLLDNPKKSSEQIAKELGLTKSTVIKDRIALKSANLLPKEACGPKRNTGVRANIIHFLRAKLVFGEDREFTIEQIANRFHCSKTTVNEAIDYLNAENEDPGAPDSGTSLVSLHKNSAEKRKKSFLQTHDPGYEGVCLPRSMYNRYMEIRRLKDKYVYSDYYQYLHETRVIMYGEDYLETKAYLH